MDDVPRGARLVGRGRSAAVYDVGDGLVLRRTTNRDYDAAGEAAAMRMAASAGVPVPRVQQVAGRDLVMERVTGPTMLDDLLAHPEHLDPHAATLADLHRRLDGVVLEEWAMRSSVPDSEGVTSFGLLHGDLHPGNVMLTTAGPVLIDWTNYRIGPRRVDLAITWILLACFGHDQPAAAGISSALRATLVGQFLAKVDRTAAAAGLREAVELRLADPATGRMEKRCIQALSGRGQPERHRNSPS